MNFLSTQPTDAAIWENLHPPPVEPAVQEEPEETAAWVNNALGLFSFCSTAKEASLWLVASPLAHVF